jgi:hypothetical protein
LIQHKRNFPSGGHGLQTTDGDKKYRLNPG